MLVFQEGKSGVPREKPFEPEQRTNNKLSPVSRNPEKPYQSLSQSLESIAAVLVVSPQMKYGDHVDYVADPGIPAFTLANVENEK